MSFSNWIFCALVSLAVHVLVNSMGWPSYTEHPFCATEAQRTPTHPRKLKKKEERRAHVKTKEGERGQKLRIKVPRVPVYGPFFHRLKVDALRWVMSFSPSLWRGRLDECERSERVGRKTPKRHQRLLFRIYKYIERTHIKKGKVDEYRWKQQGRIKHMCAVKEIVYKEGREEKKKNTLGPFFFLWQCA